MRGDVRMLDDPLRAQSLSLIAGVILAVIIVAVCAVLAFLRRPGTLGNAPIVMVRDSGALYVRIGDTVHPVMNLASARLIAGTPANPEAVNMSAISNTKSGPLVGIPGAPATIAPPLGEPESGGRCATTRRARPSSPETLVRVSGRDTASLSRLVRRARQRRICCTTDGAPR